MTHPSKHSTCQSNDSEGSCGNTSEHSFETESESLSVQNEMSTSRLVVTNEKDVSAPKSKEVEPSCVSHIKTPRQPLKDKETHKVNRKNWNDMMERELGEGYSFTKKKCCLMEKLVWTKANRVNHSNKFVPRPVQLNASRPNFNSVRPNINTGRTNINSVRPRVNAVSPKVNNVRSRQPVPHKTSNSEHPLKNMVDRGIFDSGCSGHMTGNKDQLEDFEEFNGGSVTFGGSKGYISGKGRIRVDLVGYSLASKDENSGILQTLLGRLKTKLSHRVKSLDREDNVTKFKNKISLKFVEKGIKQNQANPHAGTSEKTNNAGTSQTPKSNASEEKDEDVELIVVPSAVSIPEEIVDSRTSSTKSKKEKILTVP
ncbi:hypothetical protein Tco_0911610 [Tanacetum coccineum]|uniref:Retrovirus-related Pol polyprotein from transposon TNT 1-94-like beta-barrel domain-containing protein n=1 Tax=Tanacetum coccineum TaxID=301880 RepID=A0ABQ5CW82_9ASTR